MLFLVKIIVSAVIIATVSEIAKRSTPLAAILAGFPITSLLTFFWLYIETKSTEKILPLSWQVGLAAVPSIIFLFLLAFLLKKSFSLGTSMTIAFMALIIGQLLYLFILQKMGIKLI